MKNNHRSSAAAYAWLEPFSFASVTDEAPFSADAIVAAIEFVAFGFGVSSKCSTNSRFECIVVIECPSREAEPPLVSSNVSQVRRESESSSSRVIADESSSFSNSK